MRWMACFLWIAIPVAAACQRMPDAIFKKEKITGVQIVYSNNNVTTAYYYGKPNADDSDHVNGATVFQAASLSKVVLAYIVLKMVDRQQLSLDTPLRDYYVYNRIAADSAAQRITARMVLHHQTGFPNWSANPGTKAWVNAPLNTSFPPGSSWSYSGEGFMYLQFAVESIYKTSLEKIAAQEVFRPLGMKSSSFLWQPSFATNGAYGHNKDEESTGRNEPFLPAAAYSLLTTAEDYSLFLQAISNGTGLSRQSHALMMGDTVSVNKKDKTASDAVAHIKWGLGVGIEQNELGNALWHWGDNGDFKCFFMSFPKLHKSIVYFTNSENGLNAVPAVLDYYFGKHTWWAMQWIQKDL